MLTLHIEAETQKELHAKVCDALGFVMGECPAPKADTAAPLAEPAKRGRPPKASATAAETPAPQDTAASSASGGGTATEAGSAATTADTGQTGSDPDDEPIAYETHIKPAILDVSANYGGREAVLKLLSSFEVDHASKLTPEQWPALLEKVAELRGAG